MFKTGDSVRIKVGQGYFGPKYEGTVAKIVGISYSGLFNVEVYDGSVYTCTDDNFEHLKDADTKSSTGCKHKNKYVNSAAGVSFWVCPDCLMDLGDYKDGDTKRGSKVRS
jgi:hypothetical protein